jgi:DNA polymerase-3 subunit delta
MDVKTFREGIGRDAPPPVILFCPHKPPRARVPSFDPERAREAVGALTEALIDPSMRDLSLASYYADETEAGEVVSMANTVPFMTDYRLVIVWRAEQYDAEAGKALVAYLENPSPTTVLALVASRIDKRQALYKACEKSGAVVECPEMQREEALRWVVRQLEAQGKRIAPAAVQQLVERTSTRADDLRNALNLVRNYVGDRESIEEQDVVTACADTAEEQVWALTDAVAASDMGEAIRVLREILAMGKSEFEVMGSINWLLRSAYAVADNQRGQVKPFVARKVAPLAHKLGVEKLRDAFSLCMDTEVMFRTTGVDRSLALELLVVKLAAPRSRRAAG